jgi:1-acyl-sn-glycerol-3-phosphate acyltransferase
MSEGSKSNPELNKIDIKEVFKKKNPKIARMLPGFVYAYLKRVIHQKELNEILPKISHLYGMDFVRAGLNELGMDVRVRGKDDIPRDGHFIFVANHPLGGPDGLVFAKEVGDIFPKVRFIVNDILLNLQNFEPLFVPVNKHGRQSSEYVRKIEETYQSDAQILNFPAGLCSRKINGKIIDLEWHKSFINKAKKHKRDVIPVHISGRNSNFFYNFAKIRQFLGIKTNIEMFYLPDEMFKQRDKDVVITFGKPISYTTFDKRYTPTQWANRIKQHVYDLKEDKNKRFQP